MKEILYSTKELFIFIISHTSSFSKQVELLKQKQKILNMIEGIEKKYDILIYELEKNES